MSRLTHLWLFTCLGTTNILGAAEPNPPAKVSARDAILIEVSGQLQTGVMAIGAETTGTTITANDIRFDIDWKGQEALANRADKLNGKHVRVTGSLRQQIGPERGPRLIIEATKIQSHNDMTMNNRDHLETNGETKMRFRLESLQWQKRPLLIFASESDSTSYEQQIESLSDVQAGLPARDMAIIRVVGDSQGSVDDKQITLDSIKHLRSKYQVSADQFTVILIGKDGTVKLRKTEPVKVRELFALIDSMPMRQREMRQGQ